MQLREKVLLIGLVCVGGGWFVVRPFINSTFVTPLNDRGEKITGLKKSLDDKGIEELVQMKAEARLGRYKRRSLPPNPLDAHRLYLQWLTDLCQISGLSDLKITLGSRQEIEKTFFTVPLTIEASATTDQVVRFVKLFEAADLLHRLVRLHAVSPANDGNPLLSVTIVAEGVSMHDAPPRGRLFPQTGLVQEVDSSVQQIVVKSSKEFATPTPFLVRLESEFLKVTAVDGDRWTVERGAEETAPQKHDAESPIELFPLRPLSEGEEDPREAASRLVAHKLFVKPAPAVTYKPKFASIPAQRATRGTNFSYQLKVESWNPSHGKPVFSLEEGAPAGMAIEASTGTVTWTPPEETKPGKVDVIATAKSPTGRGDPVSASFSIDVRPANHAPKFKSIAGGPLSNPVTLYLGRRATVDLEVEDIDLPDDRLTFAFEGNPPPGAEIDSRTGRIRWTAPAETELGPQTFSVTVKDGGDPALSATTPLNVKFEDDAAAYTYLVGCLAEGDGLGEAMLHDRTTNQTLRLHPGDLIQRADLEAVILDIHPGDIVFASGSDVFRLPFGKQLREAERVRLPPVTPIAAAPESPAKVPEAAAVPAEVKPSADGATPAGPPGPASARAKSPEAEKTANAPGEPKAP